MHVLFAIFSSLFDWNVLILALFERSLSTAQVEDDKFVPDR